MTRVGSAQRNERAGEEHSVREISAMLARQAAGVARALLGQGRVGGNGQYWEVGRGRGKSLKVTLTGPHVGHWADYAIDGKRGDLLDLIMECEGCDLGAAVQWAKVWLGIAGERGRRLPPSAQEQVRRKAEAERDEAARSAQAAADQALRQAKAIDLWRAAVNAAGTPVQRYHLARGIAGPPPKTIRYLRRCFHAPSGLWLPAQIAAIQGEPIVDPDTGEVKSPIIGVHRTFLHSTEARKADVEPNKMMLGQSRGGCVRLTAAASRLILCEGIETGLSLRLTHLAAVWCGLSVSGMVAAWIPDVVTELTLAVDGDRVGTSAWLQARDRAVETHRRPGRVIKIKQPPTGLDFNDLARAYAAGGVA